jgi:uncharacterized protein
MTDLATFIATAPLVDTHEHLASEQQYLDEPADILLEVFDGGYIMADLRVAGATDAAIQRVLQEPGGDIAERFGGIAAAWDACRHTGFGEATRITAREFFGLEEITVESLVAGQAQLAAHQPGERYAILTAAHLDHVQIDSVSPLCPRDAEHPDFFLQDINWLKPATADFDLTFLHEHTKVAVKDLRTLENALQALFSSAAPRAIAVKIQHAYQRTLAWQARADSEVAPLVDRVLAGNDLAPHEANAVGDWAIERAIRWAEEHALPVKIHTGYLAGYGGMPLEWVHPAHLCPLLKQYPEVRFILMHTGYPFGGEIVALAKHYPNVYVDLCWAWALDRFSTEQFVRQYLHAAPINKLFVFGGDTQRPRSAVAYSRQARVGLARALQAEVEAGELTEAEAQAVAQRVMRDNQYAAMDIAARRAAWREQPAAS